MKKYYMAIVDFSEIYNVCPDSEQLEKARERMKQLGLLTEKGNPAPSVIGETVSRMSTAFLERLDRRINRWQGGIYGVQNKFERLYDKKDYDGFFFYLTVIYGFVEWHVPEAVRLMPAVPEVMKIFAENLLNAFYDYVSEKQDDSE